jgi:hypothetical protein
MKNAVPSETGGASRHINRVSAMQFMIQMPDNLFGVQVGVDESAGPSASPSDTGPPLYGQLVSTNTGIIFKMFCQ